MITQGRKFLAKLKTAWSTASRAYKRLIKWAALAGAVLGIVCHYMPHKYQAVCDALATLCGRG